MEQIIDILALSQNVSIELRTRFSGFSSVSDFKPKTSNFFGADVIVPSGARVAGMCSSVTAFTMMGLLRLMATLPCDPRKAQHCPGLEPIKVNQPTKIYP